MPTHIYLPADPDKIGFADALDHDEELDIEHINNGPVPIRDQVTLRPTNPPAPAAPSSSVVAAPAPAPAPVAEAHFTPDFGITAASFAAAAAAAAPPPAPAPARPDINESAPMTHQVRQIKSGLNPTGRKTHAPNANAAAPTYPEPQQVAISSAPPPLTSIAMKTTFHDGEDPYAQPGVPNPTLVTRPPSKIDAAPPPLRAAAAPAPAPAAAIAARPPPPATTTATPSPPVASSVPAAAQSPPVVSTAAATTTPPTTATTTTPPPTTTTTTNNSNNTKIPKGAKQTVTTTTTTTTKIVNGQEVTETHVHHTVVVTKKTLGLGKLFQFGGKGKKKKAEQQDGDRDKK